jgi:hypothetical protein
MSTLTGSPALKVQVMCEGIRYTESLGQAAGHSMPNYYPYRFKPGEHDPTGKGIATIPYLINTEDGTEIRILGSGDSPWHVEGNRQQGYRLVDDRSGRTVPIEFEPLRPWMTQKTADGLPFPQAGVTTHGDMLVINVAPGCEYFLHKQDGVSMRCTFCAYGAPDERTAHLGQKPGLVEIPPSTLERMREALEAVINQTEIRHIYLVGVRSPTDKGRRPVPAARALRQAGQYAWLAGDAGFRCHPDDYIERFHTEQLVQHVASTSRCGPRPVAYVVSRQESLRRISPLDRGAGDRRALLGSRQRLLCHGGGIELERARPGMEEAAASPPGRGGSLQPRHHSIYSLVWPVGGRDRTDYHTRIRSYFETLSAGYQEIRKRHGLVVSEGFMCHRCAYMQLECDLDRTVLEAA